MMEINRKKGSSYLLCCIKIAKFYNIRIARIGNFTRPKFTVMQSNTSIEVKCECRIPFHDELVSYLQNSIDTHSRAVSPEMPHKDEIRRALVSRMVFIKMVNPIRRGKKALLAAVKSLLKKDLIGTIKVGKDEITWIIM